MRMGNITNKTWEEFRESGLLWWVNRLLHTFGWALVIEVDTEGPLEGEIRRVYPARVKFRGFGNESEERGFKRISQYMVDNAEELKVESDG